VRVPFAGNVRKLANELERAVILAEPGAPITDDLLSDHIVQEADAHDAAPGALQGRTDEFEREQIAAVIARVGGVKARAAEELGLTYRGLTKKMRRLGM
jgi:two-component system response regulator HydG